MAVGSQRATPADAQEGLPACPRRTQPGHPPSLSARLPAMTPAPFLWAAFSSTPHQTQGAHAMKHRRTPPTCWQSTPLHSCEATPFKLCPAVTL